MDEQLLARMRSTPVLAGSLPRFDPGHADPAPGRQFAHWLGDALDDGVPEPHVMTLSTADRDGRPSARVLMLRGIDSDACAFVFASDAGSRKGHDLSANPHAALSWYWPLHGRQIRAAGSVEVLDAETARRDFLGRGEPSRVAGFTGRMSAPLAGPGAYDEERRRATGLVAADPGAVPAGHTVYRLRAEEMEFFQGDPDSFHVRLHYVRQGGDWRRGLLWP
ncbi:pyridoxamine 5'-phosphate oxidase family protein [Streptomyces sp. H10-C2]|uniref:pyridoxine/pyridoxamine 5'-phosphate oxidase n=1 Tax=unclassified Streptomyces TaxID=2593676 RepID=UPI0024B8EFEE|nr:MULTISPECIES: pyridoxamine 5'-phosphate oxidase family protein [unclassified Streptomyces]MDJ0343104.1 pyridoxamine 5'-phosphate oxidase family protein [Streptomyces sp. PH10-H1]MDJ0372716.1 pyridoxamine 5'-phosphate oxidase family protein [Streptomyces sp. H10-C2]